MQNIKWMLIAVLSIVLIGCTQNDNGEESSPENSDSQPINYETEKEQNERLGAENQGIDEQGGYPQSDQKRLNDGDDNARTDKFTTDTSIAISNHLKKRHDISQAQVAVTDKRVVVGIMISDNAPPDMRERVEEEVQEMVPSKEAYVYTDDIYYDRMRNKDARLDQLNGDIREYLREFFDLDREHF